MSTQPYTSEIREIEETTTFKRKVTVYTCASCGVEARNWYDAEMHQKVHAAPIPTKGDFKWYETEVIGHADLRGSSPRVELLWNGPGWYMRCEDYIDDGDGGREDAMRRVDMVADNCREEMVERWKTILAIGGLPEKP